MRVWYVLMCFLLLVRSEKPGRTTTTNVQGSGYTTGHSQGLVSDIITYQMRIEYEVCSKLDTALAKNPMSSRHRCHLVHISSLPTTMRKLRHATKCFVLPCLYWVFSSNHALRFLGSLTSKLRRKFGLWTTGCKKRNRNFVRWLVATQPQVQSRSTRVGETASEFRMSKSVTVAVWTISDLSGLLSR